MGKKKTSEMLAQRERFLSGAESNNFSSKIAHEIFDTMEKFAEYSFNKSHSTAYAIITFQTAFLKTYYPCEFMAALMTTEINTSDKIVSNVSECKEMGIEILSPDINESGAGFTPIGNSIRFGLSAIKNLGTNIVNNIIKSRDGSNKFLNIFEFLSLMDSRKMNKKSLESLIKSGGLDCFSYNRATLYNNMELLLSYVGRNNKDKDVSQEALFELSEVIVESPLEESTEWLPHDLSKYEIETLGYPVKINPLDMCQHKLSQINYKTISKIKLEDEKTAVTIAAFISSISVKTSKRNSKKYATINLEDSSDVLEAIIFNDEFEKYESRLIVGMPLLLTGMVKRTDEATKLIINSFNEIDAVQIINDVPVPIKISLKNNISLKQADNLKAIFNKYPGESPIHISFRENGLKATISVNDFKVDNCKELHEEISGTVGNN